VYKAETVEGFYYERLFVQVF